MDNEALIGTCISRNSSYYSRFKPINRDRKLDNAVKEILLIQDFYHYGEQRHEQDGSQNQQTGFPEITEDDLSSVIPQEETLKERSLKGAKKQGNQPRHTILNNPAQPNPSLHSQLVLKRAKKSTSETATVSRGGEKGIRPPDVEPPCTSRAKKSTSAASRDIVQ
ncbi:uncharacterized protein LOC120403855 isoform X2 [Mauremys reevesii]|uniref:uncharacterized protein LOC120403855 isoform X2 n=1 Tax=Mauremys reevesii TaxID=260615 RepID=UPI00193ED99C|nr:uncharacterized protein LOC120403855 isoform X2 [Mauremys reevesii]